MLSPNMRIFGSARRLNDVENIIARKNKRTMNETIIDPLNSSRISSGTSSEINPGAEALVTVNQLSKQVLSPTGELQLLIDVNFNIFSAESVAILGPSGAGKSTLLGILAGLDVPSAGQIKLGQQDIFALDEDGRAQLRGRMIGFVFQSFQLLPSLTALENVMLPLELLGLEDPEVNAQRVLARVGLGERMGHYPKQLSGGEQQRVAIARAFAVQPKILLADEPTGNLDSKTGEMIIELLFELNMELSTTLILVTHDRELAKRCNREFHIEAGRLTELER